jgi:hypothetical protein
MKILFKKIIAILFLFIFIWPSIILAYDIDSQFLVPKVEVFLSPKTSNYYLGDNFEVPIYINTKGYSINVVNIKINFDAKKIKVISPSGGKSILSIWLETPNFDNEKGTISLIGMIPGGLITNHGLVGIITFQTIGTGVADVSLTDFTSVNLNDGYGTNATLFLGNSSYNIYNKISEKIIDEKIEIDSPPQEAQEPIIVEEIIEDELVEKEIPEPVENIVIEEEIKKEVNFSTIFKQFIYNNLFIIYLIICLFIISLMIHYLLGRYFYQKNTENKILHDGYHSRDAIEESKNNTEKPL